MPKMDIISLAKALSLSKSTVSRAFRADSDINPVTRARILKLANELNYRPNHYASNLREQRSFTIAVVVPELANNYFTQIIQGVEIVAKDKGYHVLVYVTDDNIEKEKEFLTSISNGKVDGVVMSVAGENEDHSYLQNINLNKLPIILFDRVYEDVNLPRIVTDDYESSYKATEHLIESGCTRIAYFVVNKEQSIGKNRYLGYKDALRNNNIPLDDTLVIDCTNSYEENDLIIERVLKNVRPDGIFASVERLAFSTYYVCHRLGIHIPNHVKIVAFSSLEIAPLLNPSLSVVKQPALKMGEQAAQLLLQQLDNDSTPIEAHEIVLQSELIIRQSSACQ